MKTNLQFFTVNFYFMAMEVVLNLTELYDSCHSNSSVNVGLKLPVLFYIAAVGPNKIILNQKKERLVATTKKKQTEYEER